MDQKSLEEWDVLVGMWLRDVPYILRWISGKPEGGTWRSVTRTYLFEKSPPDGVLEQVPGTNFPRFKIPSLSLECITVKNYFRIFIGEGRRINLRNENHIAINGYKIHLPLYDMTAEEIYSFIGVSHPTSPMLQDWGNKLLIKFDDQRPPPPPGIRGIEIVSHLRPSEEEVQLKHSETRNLHLMFWYFRNLGKYPGVCTPVQTARPYNPTELQGSYAFTILINKQDFSDVSFSSTHDYTEIVRFCMRNPEIKKIVIPLTFQYEFLPEPVAHANLLLIDKTIHEGVRNIYLFDPWGKERFDGMISVLPKMITLLGLGSEKWRYHASGDWCPRRSFQDLEVKDKKIGDYEGFCAIWGVWILENILQNPTKTYPDIIRGSLNELSKSSPDFRKFIRQYAKSIEEYGDIMRRDVGIKFLTPKSGESHKFTYADKALLYKYTDKQRGDYLQELRKQDPGDKWDVYAKTLEARPSVGDRVWYLRKSKSSYKICSDLFTSMEDQVLKNKYSLRLRGIYHTDRGGRRCRRGARGGVRGGERDRGTPRGQKFPCYIFYPRHLQEISKLFPGIQEKKT